MALVLRNSGCVASPIEILDIEENELIEIIDTSNDEEEVMSDDDNLPSDIEDHHPSSRRSNYYAYDAEEELRRFLVTPDLSGVFAALQSCKKISLNLHNIAKAAIVGNPGFFDLLLRAAKFAPPEFVISLLGEIGQGKSSLINSLLNCANAALTVSTIQRLHVRTFANINTG
jgi:hypothetical protein